MYFMATITQRKILETKTAKNAFQNIKALFLLKIRQCSEINRKHFKLKWSAIYSVTLLEWVLGSFKI